MGSVVLLPCPAPCTPGPWAEPEEHWRHNISNYRGNDKTVDICFGSGKAQGGRGGSALDSFQVARTGETRCDSWTPAFTSFTRFTSLQAAMERPAKSIGPVHSSLCGDLYIVEVLDTPRSRTTAGRPKEDIALTIAHCMIHRVNPTADSHYKSFRGEGRGKGEG